MVSSDTLLVLTSLLVCFLGKQTLRQGLVCRKFTGCCPWDQYLLGNERNRIGKRIISRGVGGVSCQ